MGARMMVRYLARALAAGAILLAAGCAQLDSKSESVSPVPVSANPMADVSALAEAQAKGDDDAVLAAARRLAAQDPAAMSLGGEAALDFQTDLAATLAEAGAPDEAATLYRAVLGRLDATGSPDLSRQVAILTRLAELSLKEDEPEAAAARLDDAIARAGGALGPDHPRVQALRDLKRAMAVGEDGGAQAAAPDVAEGVGAGAGETAELVAAPSARMQSLEVGAPQPRSARAERGEAPFDLVPVFYGANRARVTGGFFGGEGGDDPYEFYGAGRGDLETGVVTVSVPKNRAFGEIPKPNVWLGEFRPDPAKHVILEDLEAFPNIQQFVAELRQEVDRSNRREAVVFIHGYNTTFAEAAERTAQIAVDLEVDGAAVLYSWPSSGAPWGYFSDRNQIVRPIIRDLETFLTVVSQQSGAERVHVVAHSMGNEFLMRALERISNARPAAPLFDQVVFAAPDMDAADFEAAASELGPVARDMTLYASSQDAALKWSKRLQGGDYRRAGDADPPLLLASMATVDTTPASNSAFGHADIFGPALPDLQAMLWHSLNPQRRCVLTDERRQSGEYWVFGLHGEQVCDETEFKEAMTTLRRLGPDLTYALLEDKIAEATATGADASAARWRGALAILKSLEE